MNARRVFSFRHGCYGKESLLYVLFDIFMPIHVQNWMRSVDIPASIPVEWVPTHPYAVPLDGDNGNATAEMNN